MKIIAGAMVPALLLLATACGGGTSTSAAADGPASSTTSVDATDGTDGGGDADGGDSAPSLPPLTPCPTAAAPAAPVTFPTVPPAALPRPDDAVDPQVLPGSPSGVAVLRFTTPESLRDAVLFVTQAYPAAGWVLGDGDSEQDEADIPFTKGAVHGKLRLSGDGACTTTWTVATVSGSDAGLDAVPDLEGHDG